jgi:hypothetical protein
MCGLILFERKLLDMSTWPSGRLPAKAGRLFWRIMLGTVIVAALAGMFCAGSCLYLDLVMRNWEHM